MTWSSSLTAPPPPPISLSFPAPLLIFWAAGGLRAPQGPSLRGRSQPAAAGSPSGISGFRNWAVSIRLGLADNNNPTPRNDKVARNKQGNIIASPALLCSNTAPAKLTTGSNLYWLIWPTSWLQCSINLALHLSGATTHSRNGILLLAWW